MSEWKVPNKRIIERTLTMSGGSNPDNQKTTTHKQSVEMSIEEYNRIFKKPKRKLNWFDKMLCFRR